MRTQKRKKIFIFKQHITKDPQNNDQYLFHPPSHQYENLIAVQGSSNQINAKQNIIVKSDKNSY